MGKYLLSQGHDSSRLHAHYHGTGTGRRPSLKGVKVVSHVYKREVRVRNSTSDQDVPSQATQKTVILKTKEQRRQKLLKDTSKESGTSGPRRCKEAMDKGLELFQAKEYDEAIEMFTFALELPGNGAYRVPGSPREYSCPSDAEENAALYNMACCYAQMNQKASALTCLEAVLENEFKDFNTIRSDPDLATIRGPELDSLLSKYENPLTQFRKIFDRKEKPLVSDTNKPWIMW